MNTIMMITILVELLLLHVIVFYFSYRIANKKHTRFYFKNKWMEIKLET